MRTSLTKGQVAAIVTKYFEDQDSSVNFIYDCLDDDGFSGYLIDHDLEVELPNG